MSIRNFNARPRTLRESLETILKTARAGRLAVGELRIHDDTKGKCYCSIGSLLPKKMLDVCAEGGFADAASLFGTFGAEVMHKVTGMTEEQVACIMDENDNCVGPYSPSIKGEEGYIAELNKILENGRGFIRNAEFVLDTPEEETTHE